MHTPIVPLLLTLTFLLPTTSTLALAPSPLLTLNNDTLQNEIYIPTCLKLPAPPLPGLNPYYCRKAIAVICEKLLAPPHLLWRSRWIWTDLPGCSMGYYLPEGTEVPLPGECEVEVYGSIYQACAENSRWNAGAINVEVVPSEETAGTSGGLGDEWPRYMMAPARLTPAPSAAAKV